MINHHQIKARENFNRIIQSFISIPDGYEVATTEDLKRFFSYPDYYSGAFIKNDVLFVGIVNNFASVKTKLSNLTDGKVEFIEQTFSLSYLKSLIEYLYDTDKNLLNCIIFSGIDQEKNCVIISVDAEQTAEKFASLLNRHGFDSKSYQIQVGRPIEPTAIYVRPGDPVYKWLDGIRQSNLPSTICCDGSKNFTNFGFITCAHLLWKNPSVLLGTADYPCQLPYIDYSSDAVFVPFAPQINGVSGIISSALTQNNRYMLMDLVTNFVNSKSLKGESLIGFGLTSKTMYGTIELTSCNFHYEQAPPPFNVTITDGVTLRCPLGMPAGGDSGGIWTKIIGQNGEYTTLSAACMQSGITSHDEENYTTAFTVKLFNIYNRLLLTSFAGGGDKTIP